MSASKFVFDTSDLEPAGDNKFTAHDFEPVMNQTPVSMQPHHDESFLQSLGKAPFRVAEDLYRRGFNVLKSIPDYYESAKSEVPGLFQTAAAHPKHLLGQFAAGLPELGHNIINIPYDLASYGSDRLNLIPKSAAENVIHQGDISGDINQLFGEPIYPGEKLARGLVRNSLNLGGAGKVASVLNPLNLTAKSIAKDVLGEEARQVKLHSKEYNSLWDEAEKSGFNQVPVNNNMLNQNLDIIKKYKTPREYKALNNFIESPTLANAQKAQSDMGIMKRNLEEKSRTSSLTSEENAIYQAAQDSENHIENNMFKDAKGNTNNALKDRYDVVTKSYRENVVPYKYNRAIQQYKNKEMLASELVNALSRGEFAAKKGNMHPEIKIRNALWPTSIGAAGLGGGAYLYNQMFGTPTQTNQ